MADQKKNRKKVLVASCILAALIVGSSSFAWFTSQDEVTNRLAASNNYGVTITESFTPPTQWVPGQEINKDVGAVNTGNVDAFVRMAISNKLNLTAYTEGKQLPKDGNGKYNVAPTDTANLVVLNKEFTDAVEENSSNNAVGARADEVTTIQAGGKLVIAAGDTVSPSDAQNIPSANYKPSKTGLYIFQREIKYLSDYTYDYAGYYYVATEGDTGGNGTYYAIDIASDALIKNTDGTVTLDNSSNKITLKATKNQVLDDSNVKLNYDKVTTNNVVTATYVGADNTKDTDDDIIININLAETWSNFWSYDTVTNKFYLNSTLSAGKESAKLIDSVTLDSKVQKQAYIDFNYDLTVSLESIQVAYDEAKSDEYKPTAVNATWGPSGYPRATVSGGSTVTWAFTAP